MDKPGQRGGRMNGGRRDRWMDGWMDRIGNLYLNRVIISNLRMRCTSTLKPFGIQNANNIYLEQSLSMQN